MKKEPKLTVIFARRKPRGIILRRGPSDWYHLISWNTAKDTFEHGAWFKGRIYEDKCDLSPDGELFLYFALKGDWQSSYMGSWTAISRPPWLSALTLWPQGDTWGGGGCFQDDRQLSLRGVGATHPDHPLNGLEIVEGNCNKESPRPDIPEAEWSGYDHSGYEVFTCKGRLYRRLPNGDKELANFIDLEPSPQEAPQWARAPLPPLRSGSSNKKSFDHELQLQKVTAL